MKKEYALEELELAEDDLDRALQHMGVTFNFVGFEPLRLEILRKTIISKIIDCQDNLNKLIEEFKSES